MSVVSGDTENEDRLFFRPEDVIRFATGVPGYDEHREFLIMSRPEYEPFHILVSIHDPKLQFPLINPLLVRPDYDPPITAHELRELRVQDPADLLLYSIVTMHEDMSQSTTNLLGPLFINIRQKVGKQILVEDSRYSINQKVIH